MKCFFRRVISKLFQLHQQRACVINENKEEVKYAMSVAKRFDFITDGFTDYKKVLFNLHSNKQYSVVIIHENGNKSKPNMLTSFIHQLHPNLPVIVYKTEEQLKCKLQSLV